MAASRPVPTSGCRPSVRHGGSLFERQSYACRAARSSPSRRWPRKVSQVAPRAHPSPGPHTASHNGYRHPISGLVSAVSNLTSTGRPNTTMRSNDSCGRFLPSTTALGGSIRGGKEKGSKEKGGKKGTAARLLCFIFRVECIGRIIDLIASATAPTHGQQEKVAKSDKGKTMAKEAPPPIKKPERDHPIGESRKDSVDLGFDRGLKVTSRVPPPPPPKTDKKQK